MQGRNSAAEARYMLERANLRYVDIGTAIHKQIEMRLLQHCKYAGLGAGNSHDRRKRRRKMKIKWQTA